jgi:hypothetical protein
MESTENRVFDGHEKYELRVYLRDSKVFTGTSEPILVDVRAISEAQLKAAKEASKVILQGELNGVPDGQTEKALLAAVEPLDDCALKRTGLLLAAMAAVRDANTRDGFEQALRRVAELRKECSEPMQDWANLTLANTLYGINQLDLAVEEARRLPADSFERERIERSISQKMSEATRTPADRN